MEIWKNIEEYEGLYQISNLGKVRSLDRYVTDVNKTQFIKGKNLKAGDNGKGYLIVSLLKNGFRKNHYIHRLVAKHFLENYDSKKVVNHKDFNTKNNSVNNLEVVTQKENIKYSNANKRYDKAHINNAINHRKKALIKILDNEEKILEKYDNGESIISISKKMHLKAENVSNFIKNKRYEKIICIETGEQFDTIKQANDKYGVTTIGDTIAGRQKTSAGYHWIKKKYKVKGKMSWIELYEK